MVPDSNATYSPYTRQRHYFKKESNRISYYRDMSDGLPQASCSICEEIRPLDQLRNVLPQKVIICNECLEAQSEEKIKEVETKRTQAINDLFK